MKMLLDNNVPKYLMGLIEGAEVKTAYQEGFASLSNGKLIAACENNQYDYLVTLDQNLEYQQNLRVTSLKFIVLVPSSQARTDFEVLIPRLNSALRTGFDRFS